MFCQDLAMSSAVDSSLNGYREMVEEILADQQPDGSMIFTKLRLKPGYREDLENVAKKKLKTESQFVFRTWLLLLFEKSISSAL